jgi:hypothetical protein
MPSRRNVLKSDGERPRPRADTDDHGHFDDLTRRPGRDDAPHARPLPAAEQRHQPVQVAAGAVGRPGQDLPDRPRARECLGEKPGELLWPFARTFASSDPGRARHRVSRLSAFGRGTADRDESRGARTHFTVKGRPDIGHWHQAQAGQVVDRLICTKAHVRRMSAAARRIMRRPLGRKQRWHLSPGGVLGANSK